MIDVWTNLAMLGIESTEVVFKRLAAISTGGPAAVDEIHLMITEKIVAASFAGVDLLGGKSMNAIVSDYRGIVQDNLKRLPG